MAALMILSLCAFAIVIAGGSWVRKRRQRNQDPRA